MANDPFDLANLERRLPQKTKAIIADLVLSWGRFDALMTQLLIVTFNLELDTGAILIGNMDTRSKFDKIIKLYDHHGLSGKVVVEHLKKLHGKHVDLRNTISHSVCAGRFKSDRNMIVFAPVKIVKGEVGNMLVEAHHIDKFHAAIAFAKDNGDEINSLIDQMLALRAKRARPKP